MCQHNNAPVHKVRKICFVKLVVEVEWSAHSPTLHRSELF